MVEVLGRDRGSNTKYEERSLIVILEKEKEMKKKRKERWMDRLKVRVIPKE